MQGGFGLRGGRDDMGRPGGMRARGGSVMGLAAAAAAEQDAQAGAEQDHDGNPGRDQLRAARDLATPAAAAGLCLALLCLARLWLALLRPPLRPVERFIAGT